MITTVGHLSLSTLRAALRDLKQHCRAHHGALGFSAPTLALSADGLAIVITVTAVAIGSHWRPTVEVPRAPGALRLRFSERRTLQRLAMRQIGPSSRMSCHEWTRTQALARLDLATIARGDGWVAEITEVGLIAMRRGWIA